MKVLVLHGNFNISTDSTEKNTSAAAWEMAIVSFIRSIMKSNDIAGNTKRGYKFLPLSAFLTFAKTK